MPSKPKRSAGILAFRLGEGALEVLLIHPGGPLWAKKDAGSWSIPKGLYTEDEDALVAAKREFEEETGLKPVGDFIELGAFRQPSGKTISAWAVENDFDISAFKSNTFSMEWGGACTHYNAPPLHGGRQRQTSSLACLIKQAACRAACRLKRKQNRRWLAEFQVHGLCCCMHFQRGYPSG